MTTCMIHTSFPKIMECEKCRKEYEEVILRWHGQVGVDKFKEWYAKEKMLEAIREL